jgi:uncharacterized protein YkwD
MAPLQGLASFFQVSRHRRGARRIERARMIAPAEQLESRIALSISPSEQEFIYLLNRARQNPAAYQIERGLSTSLSSITPRQPLAVNTRLTAAAGLKSEEMATRNYFSHTSVTGETPNQLVRRFGYDLPERVSVGGQTYLLPTVGNQIESLAGGQSTPSAALQGLIESSGHRNHLLGVTAHNQVAREVGIGYHFRQQATYKHYWTVLITPSKATTPFLTGVAFVDGNNNRRFEGNEGLGNVTITASGPGGTFTTTTAAAGGWALAVPQGDYVVTASGGSFSGTSLAPVRVGTQNVAVDFVSGASAAWVNFAQIGNTVPAVPTNVVATAGTSQASLTWTAPASNGGAALTHYAIQFSSNNGGTWTTVNRAASTATTATVTGLVNSTSYIFRIAAVNSVGTGGYSTNSNSVRTVAQATVPAAPTNVVATVGNGQASLTWNTPSSNGGAAITQYAIQFSSNNGGAWTTVNRAASTATTATVTGLVNGTNYIFRIAAVNSTGIGSYSTNSNSVRPNASPASITQTTTVSGSISAVGEVDSFSVAVAPGAIVRATVNSSHQELFPLIDLTSTGGAILKRAVAYGRTSADLGMYDLTSGTAVILVKAQAGRTGSYTLNVTVTTRAELVSEVIRLTNVERQRAGLVQLVSSSLLQQAAQSHVQDMDNNNRFLAHTGSNGSSPDNRIKAVGYKMAWVSEGNRLRGIRLENAASGQLSAAEVVQGWMNSAGHRAAIMDPATKEIGVGFEYDDQTGYTYWIQKFGNPWRPGMNLWF